MPMPAAGAANALRRRFALRQRLAPQGSQIILQQLVRSISFRWRSENDPYSIHAWPMYHERALRPISYTAASTSVDAACHQLVKSQTASLNQPFLRRWSCRRELLWKLDFCISGG
jgi:hypothetical protein